MNPFNYQKTSFENYLKSKAFASKSIQRRLIVINIFLKWLEKENVEPEQVSYNDLLLYMKDCSHRGASQRTIQNYIGVIKHYYEYLIKEETITINPTSDIEIKGVKRKILYHILETHELHALYNNYPTSSIQQSRNKVILGMLVYQGLKTEELGKLEVSDINLREGKLTVSGSRKSNSREMKLESHQVMDIYDYVLKIRDELVVP